ncbi:DUF4942 domain-containing protein [Pseudomonas baetica]|uniref:DUF4942 domain-containing protein n=1 Tax=Pseudomonas baetica TaxID=674054 RepID=UPI0024061051|nr:DUF4942 domain-containing protein [Pseudomonas baetica]MDF9779111.1 hypothetical protein [Pseudomonas baetica]
MQTQSCQKLEPMLLGDHREAIDVAPYGIIESLVSQHRHQKLLIERVSALMEGSGYDQILGYFLAGADEELAVRMQATPNLFDQDRAIKALDAEYWNRALDLTNVREIMPSARLAEWDTQIAERTCLAFEEAAVRDTLASMLASRKAFLAERVDTVFHALSPDHITNSPAGFSKRMIINSARCKATGSPNPEITPLISDLRFVIAMLMGRDAPAGGANYRALDYGCANTGSWVLLDGGALRVRFHLTGTVHIEINPEMVYRLNDILSSLYPNAIPSRFRHRPKSTAVDKEWPLIETPVSFGVLAILANLKTKGFRPGEWLLDSNVRNSPYMAEADGIIEALGGAKLREGSYAFPYPDVREVLDVVIASGRLPEQKTHQFYGTNEKLGKEAARIADIKDGETLCEPSAGQAGIARFLPKERTTCVEVSAVNCAILRQHDFKEVIEADFLQWARTGVSFDKLIMNPPFSQGRAQAHLEAAALVARRRIVAILPASLRGKDVLPGWDLQWSQVYEGEFKGTNASVTILRADKAMH